MNFSFQAHISSMPGYEILSTNEKKLCANLRLTPAHYISYKTCLLTNHLQKKKGQTPKPLNPSGLDKNNRKIIFNFLMRAGWITAYWKIHATKKRKNSFAFYFLCFKCTYCQWYSWYTYCWIIYLLFVILFSPFI